MKKTAVAILHVLYLLTQCTWGVLQNLLGFLMFLRHVRCERRFFHGAVLVFHDGNWGGVSLGAFIFVSGKRGEEWARAAAVHEYGHTIQSLILGPLYLLVIGLPSFVWCNSKRCARLREEKSLSYYDLFCERGANRLGQLFTGEPAPVPERPSPVRESSPEEDPPAD